jgi:hypothetical protein
MIDVKSDIDISDLLELSPELYFLFAYAYSYCKKYKLNFKITSLISDRGNTKSVSKTHEQGRAFDISVQGWNDVHIHRLVYLVNTKFKDIAAISAKDLQPRAAIFHNYKGQGDHIHFQVRPNADLSLLLGE